MKVEDSQKVRSYRKTLDEKIASLANSICSELSDPLLIKSQVRSNINRLLRLNMAEKVRSMDIFISLFLNINLYLLICLININFILI